LRYLAGFFNNVCDRFAAASVFLQEFKGILIVYVAKCFNSLMNYNVSVVALNDTLQKSLNFLVVGLRISHLAEAVADFVLK